MRESSIDAPRSACAGAGLAAGVRVQALIDTPEFYGTLAASVYVASTVMVRGFEVGAGARVVDYRFAQNAVVTAGEFSFGPLQLGLARSFRAGPRLVWTPHLRLDTPGTDTGHAELISTVAAGVTASYELRPGLVGHGRVVGLAWASTPVDDLTAREAALVSADVGWRARRWLALLGGAELQAGWYRGGLDHALLRLGVRFRRCCGALEVGAALPLAGAERTDAVIHIGWRRTGF
jgi:hypothetical protein